MTNYNLRPVITSSCNTRQDISTALWSATNFPWQETFFPWQWIYPQSYNIRTPVTSSYTTRPTI